MRSCKESPLLRTVPMANLLLLLSLLHVIAPVGDAFSPAVGYSRTGPTQSGSLTTTCTTTTATTRDRRPLPLFLFEPSLPNFCVNCGSDNMVLKIPPDDERLRACCEACGRIDYQNPKIVVSCVVRTPSTKTMDSNNDDDERILLAKRAIEPRRGTWGIPQGFMELGETSRQAAVREVYEETGAIIDPSSLIFRALYNVPGSVQLVYEAPISDLSKLQQEIQAYNSKNNSDDDNNNNKCESLEVALLSNEELVEKELCFPTVQWALDHCRSSSSTTSSGGKIQQMTKYFDAEKESWSQFEDELLQQ